MMEDNEGIAATGSNNTAVIGSEEHEELSEEELAYWIDWYDAIFSNYIIIAKVVSFFSAMGSAFIIYKLVFDVRNADDRKRKLDRSYDRLLLCLCVSDFISSVATFFGSWAIPANPSIEYETAVYDHFSDWEVTFGVGFWDDIRFAFGWDDFFPQAAGTTGTCAAQGWFWFVGAFSSHLFSASISLCFLFQVRFEWRQQRMRIAEKVLFAFSTLIPISYSTYALFAPGGYRPNPAVGWCVPVNDGFAVFSALATGLVQVIIIICLGTLFWTVRNQELRAARWSVAAASGRQQKQVFVKSMMYIGASLFINIPPFVVLTIAPKFTYYSQALCYPMQGVLNALIYTDLFRNECKRQASSISTSVKSSVTRGMDSLTSSYRSRRKSSASKNTSGTGSYLTNAMPTTPARRDGTNEGEGVMTMSMAFKLNDQNETIDTNTTGSVEETKGETSESTTEHDTGGDDARKDSIGDVLTGDDTNFKDLSSSFLDIESAGSHPDSGNRKKYESKKVARGPAAVFATGETVSVDVVREAMRENLNQR